MQTKRTIALAVAALGGAAVLSLPSGATADQGHQMPIDDGVPCYDHYYDCGTASEETGVVTEPSSFYDYSPDAAYGRCRTRWAARKQHNVVGGLQWSYYQQVRWCWNGSVVTKLKRDRWVGGTGYGWGFDGHIFSNCQLESCSGKVGSYSETVSTEGHFHVCLGMLGISFCRHKYPWVTITVYASGASAASTSS